MDQNSCNESLVEILMSFNPQQGEKENNKDIKQVNSIDDQKHEHSSFLNMQGGVQIVKRSGQFSRQSKNHQYFKFGVEQIGFQDYPTYDYEHSSADHFPSVYEEQQDYFHNCILKMCILFQRRLTIMRKLVFKQISKYSKSHSKPHFCPHFSFDNCEQISSVDDPHKLDSLFTFRDKGPQAAEYSSPTASLCIHNQTGLDINLWFPHKNIQICPSQEPKKIIFPKTLAKKSCRQLYLPDQNWKQRKQQKTDKLGKLFPDFLKEEVIDQLGFSPDFFADSPFFKSKNIPIKQEKKTSEISRSGSYSFSANKSYNSLAKPPSVLIQGNTTIKFSPIPISSNFSHLSNYSRENSSNNSQKKIMRPQIKKLGITQNLYSPKPCSFRGNSPQASSPKPFRIQKQATIQKKIYISSEYDAFPKNRPKIKEEKKIKFIHPPANQYFSYKSPSKKEMKKF